MSLVLFFKQKTAYEMRISDWSSDVCSSDLSRIDGAPALAASIDGDEEIAGKQRACDPFHLAGVAAQAGILRQIDAIALAAQVEGRLVFLAGLGLHRVPAPVAAPRHVSPPLFFGAAMAWASRSGPSPRAAPTPATAASWAAWAPAKSSSEQRRVGKAWVRTVRSRWSPSHNKQKK